MILKLMRFERLSKAPFFALLRMYRLTVSLMIGPACRFEPSCSRYAEEAIERFGLLKGSFYAMRRILRCHPFSPGGHDPVPSISPTPFRAKTS
jgi:putative membrane protein insertion efficiency factor